MPKLTLKLDDLRVETFAAGPDGSRLGTVRANGFEETAETDPAVGEDQAFLQTPVFACPIRSADTQCYSICYTCRDPTCDSCSVTRCRDTCA